MSDLGPDRIWLQCRDSDDPENRDVDLSEATWCIHEIDSTDEEYVRLDLHANLRAKMERLEEAGNKLTAKVVEVARRLSSSSVWAEDEVQRELWRSVEALDHYLEKEEAQ